MKKLLALLLLITITVNAQVFVSAKLDTISVGDTLSAGIDTEGLRVILVKVPDSFDGSAITLYHSSDNVNFNPVYNSDDDTILSFSVTAGREYRLKPAEYFFAKRYVKIESNAAVTTTADSFYVSLGKY